MRLISMLLLGAAASHPDAAAVQLHGLDAGVVRATPEPGATGALLAARLQLEIGTGDRSTVLELAPHRVLGTFGSTEGEAQAYAGALPGRPGSWAALTLTRRGWSGIWFDGEEFYGIEPAQALAGTGHPALEGAAPGQPMVFNLRDVDWGEASFEGDMAEAPAGNAQELVTGLPRTSAALFGGPTHELAISMVADHFMAYREGDNLEAHLLAQLNIIDGVFRNQVGLQVTSASITTFSRRQEDPLSSTTDPNRLLNELSDWRAGNRWQRQTALTHLFTGRDLDRRTVGLAFTGSLCTRRYSASLSEAREAPSFAALVAAHEIAHVLGAPHDGDAAGACGAVNGSTYLMAPRINGSQQFSGCSIAQMMPTIEEASCLTPPIASGGKGGGGALAGTTLGLLGLLAALRTRRRALQMRANQSAR